MGTYTEKQLIKDRQLSPPSLYSTISYHITYEIRLFNTLSHHSWHSRSTTETSKSWFLSARATSNLSGPISGRAWCLLWIGRPQVTGRRSFCSWRSSQKIVCMLWCRAMVLVLLWSTLIDWWHASGLKSGIFGVGFSDISLESYESRLPFAVRGRRPALLALGSSWAYLCDVQVAVVIVVCNAARGVSQMATTRAGKKWDTSIKCTSAYVNRCQPMYFYHPTLIPQCNVEECWKVVQLILVPTPDKSWERAYQRITHNNHFKDINNYQGAKDRFSWSPSSCHHRRKGLLPPQASTHQMMIMQQQQKHRASQYILLLPAAVGSAIARLLKKEFYETRKMIPSIFPSMLSWIEW